MMTKTEFLTQRAERTNTLANTIIQELVEPELNQRLGSGDMSPIIVHRSKVHDTVNKLNGEPCDEYLTQIVDKAVYILRTEGYAANAQEGDIFIHL